MPRIGEEELAGGGVVAEQEGCGEPALPGAREEAVV